MAYNYDSVPNDLKQLPQWVVWKKETDEKGKVKKVPRNPITGYGASSTNPETWNTFETVKGVYETAGTYDGIGFVFNNSGIVGIDLDHCIDETGQMTETAQEIIQVLDSYTEYSPQRHRRTHLCLRYPTCGREKERTLRDVPEQTVFHRNRSKLP